MSKARFGKKIDGFVYGRKWRTEHDEGSWKMVRLVGAVVVKRGVQGISFFTAEYVTENFE